MTKDIGVGAIGAGLRACGLGAGGRRLDWQLDYALGIDEIDTQHRQIFDHMASLEKAVCAGDRWHVVHFLLVELDDLMKFHFAVEESLMRIIGYPGFAGHRTGHAKISANLADLQRRCLREDISDDLTSFLRDWFFLHIQEADRQYANFARERFPGLTPP